MMKKILRAISLVTVISTLFVFASCKQEPTVEETTTEPETVEATELTTESEAETTTEKVKATLIASVGVGPDCVPYKYKNGDNIEGINIDIMNALAEKLGMTLKIAETDSVSSQDDSQKVDVIINQSNSEVPDADNASYSKNYMSDIQSVVVKASSEYRVYDDFYSGFDSDGAPSGVKDGIKIGVKKNTTGDTFASAPLNEWGFGSESVVKYDTTEALINALVNDEVTAVIIDDAIAEKSVSNTSGLKILDSSFYSTDYRIAVVSEDEEKRNTIVSAVNELIDNGTIQSIVDSYMN